MATTGGRWTEAAAPGGFDPDPPHWVPLDFPPPWPARPWIYANVIASANGIVAWRRAGPDDDPVRAVAGGDFSRPGRRVDVRLMRRLRAAADAVSFGAQTLRDQPKLIGGVEDAGPLSAELVRHREAQGLPRVPLQVVYSASGQLDLGVPLFNTAGVRVVVVTTRSGADALRAGGAGARGVTLMAVGEPWVDAPAMVLAHERLFAEHGVRYLDCEGGAVVLESLHAAGLLDEIFVTVTDVEIDPAAHAGIKRIGPLDAGAGRLVAEGRTGADPGYRFQRWRLNDR
jgi:riboflavin biosynthesis pyrimidine reductase